MMNKTNRFRMVELGSVLSLLRNGLSLKQSKQAGGLPITRIETISNGEVDANRVGYADCEVDEYGQWLMMPGDILFSHINSEVHLGKVAQYDGTPRELIHGMNLLNLRADCTLILPRYLLWVLHTDSFRRQVRRVANRSVNQASVSTTALSHLSIPLPRLPEQKRIADILDKADAIRRKRRGAEAQLDRLIESSFLEAFGDPVSNSRAWPLVPLCQYGRITTGNTPPRNDPSNYGDAIEWIKSDNINTPSHYVTQATEGLSKKGLSLARTAANGSTLVTCIAGSRDCVGNAALTDRTVAFNQQINAITPYAEVDPHFLYTLILLSKRLVQKASTDSMKGMVSKGKLEQVQVIDVPATAQSHYGCRFKRILSSLNNYASARLLANDLFESLVQRAFKGEF